jgi:hypothetical protein
LSPIDSTAAGLSDVLNTIHSLIAGESNAPKIKKKQTETEEYSSQLQNSTESKVQVLDLRLRKLIGNIAKYVNDMGSKCKASGDGKNEYIRGQHSGSRAVLSSPSIRSMIMKEMSAAKAATLSLVKQSTSNRKSVLATTAASTAAVTNGLSTTSLSQCSGLHEPRVGNEEVALTDARQCIIFFRDTLLLKLSELLVVATDINAAAAAAGGAGAGGRGDRSSVGAEIRQPASCDKNTAQQSSASSDYRDSGDDDREIYEDICNFIASIVAK